MIKRTSGDDRNKARLHLLDLFEIFPPDDAAVKKARTQLTACCSRACTGRRAYRTGRGIGGPARRAAPARAPRPPAPRAAPG